MHGTARICGHQMSVRHSGASVILSMSICVLEALHRYHLIPDVGHTDLWLVDFVIGTIADLPLDVQKKNATCIPPQA